MFAIVGGTGLTKLSQFEINASEWIDTPYGETSSAVLNGTLQGNDVLFLARHGDPHQIPPHKINYRANMYALKKAGATKILAVNAVGGIHEDFGPADIAIPDQIIDYTYGREHTLYDGSSSSVEHVDFSFPYSASLRKLLLECASEQGLNVLDQGVYGATQGPRLETAAEIQKLKADGCDMVGMTGMPEAALARELEIEYACIALSVNWAAGLTDSIITMDDINQAIEQGMSKVHSLLIAALHK